MKKLQAIPKEHYGLLLLETVSSSSLSYYARTATRNVDVESLRKSFVENMADQPNAINQAMNQELHHAWQRFRDDDDAFVLVVTGAGEKFFCAGWDLKAAAAGDAVDGIRVRLATRRV